MNHCEMLHHGININVNDIYDKVLVCDQEMTVYYVFILSGETDSNKSHTIQGQLDVPLNDTGRGQAERASKVLKDVPFVKAYSSDLLRALETGEIIMRYTDDRDQIENTLSLMVH